MKTIGDLNNRWWYRFAKVVYSTIFIISTLGFSIGFLWSTYWYPEIEIVYLDSRLIQSVPRGTVSDLSSNISMSRSEYRKKYEQYTKDNVRGLTLEELVAIGAKPSTLSFGPDNSVIPVNQFKTRINVEYRDWWSALGYSFLSIFINLFLFEFGRRSFYYIVTGKINPSKK